MADTYCESGDLLLGDLTLKDGYDKDKWVDLAADEINSRLGYLYVIPLEDAESDEINPASLLVLKNINRKLASGRLILDIGIGGEDNALQAYGLSLVQEAYNELEMVLGGSLPLSGAARLDSQVGSSVASTTNVDSHSGVDAFYKEFTKEHTHLTWPPFPRGGVWKPNDV